jgi:hypothetical protein
MTLKIKHAVTLIFVLFFSLQLSLATNINIYTSFENDTVFELKLYQLADSIIQDLRSDNAGDSAQFFDFRNINPIFWKKANKFTIEPLDYLTLESNPLFKPLVLKKTELKDIWDASAELQKAIYTNNEESKIQKYLAPFSYPNPYLLLKETRAEIERRIRLSKPELFAYQVEKLPNTADLKSNVISTRPLAEIALRENTTIGNGNKKLTVQKIVASPWTKRASVLAQFSQNMVTNNWYQGGNSNMSVLGVLNAQFNYDNKKNIQFENNAEWRMGFYFVDDSTALRAINTNNDLVRINSKLGYKINGNWFYSGNVEFSTQLLKNYRAVNSNVLKSTFLSPIRLNAGIGLDYKYQKIFSLALSPIAYKYIYLVEKDPMVLNPNLFGIKTGEHYLSEIGSSLRAQASYAPSKEIQLDSKLYFFTNYQKVEVDWEIIGNFTINRFLSTRLSLNPRYDNTILLTKGEKARLQFKEFLSFGFTYKLLK